MICCFEKDSVESKMGSTKRLALKTSPTTKVFKQKG